MISKRVIIAVALIGFGFVVSLRSWQAASFENQKDHDALHESTIVPGSSGGSSSVSETSRTKSRIRTHYPRPTIEETTALVRTTIIPVIDFPSDQSLPERVARLNELIQKAGVEPYRLRLIVRSADPIAQLRFKDELRIREIPLGIALKYICDSTKIRYEVRENGIVELKSWQDYDSLPDAANLPQRKLRSPSRETETFLNDPAEAGEIDPFADPPTQ